MPVRIPGGGGHKPLDVDSPTYAPPPIETAAALPDITIPTIDAYESIYERMRLFRGMARRRPYLAGSLIGSPSLSDYTVGQIATQLETVVDWTDQRTAIAGVPGYAAGLRNMLLQIPMDSDLSWLRSRGLELIDEIQKLTPEDQALVLSLLNGHPLINPVGALARGEEVIGQVTGAEVVEGQFAFDSRAAATTVAALFPKFPIRLIEDTGFNINELTGSLQGMGVTPLTPLGDVTDPQTADIVAAYTGQTFARPFELAGAVGGAGLEMLPGGKVARDIVGGTVRGALTGLMWAGDQVIKPALSLGGLKPGDPGYDSSYSAAQFLFGYMAIGTVLKAGRASKQTRVLPREQAAAALNLRLTPVDWAFEPISRLIWDLRNKTVQQWFTDTRAGRATLAEWTRIKAEGGDVAGVLAERAGGQRMPAHLVRAVTEAATPEDVPRAVLDALGPGGEVRWDALRARRDAIYEQLQTHPAADVELALRSELLTNANAMRWASEQTPVWRFPKKNILRASLRHPVTRIERIISTGMKPARRLPEKFVDELPRYAKLHSPIDESRPLDWVDQNADTASKWMRRAGVKQKAIDARIADLYNTVIDGQSFKDWAISIGRAIDDALPKNTPADLRARLTHPWDRPAEARTRSVVTNDVGGTNLDGTPMRGHEYALRDPDTGAPLSSMPTEYAQSVTLPDIDLAIEATSILRRSMTEARKVGWGKMNVGLVYDVPKYFLELQTAILKPAVLDARILGALPLRIQLEQFVRSWLFEGRPIFSVRGEGYYLGPGGIPVPRSLMKPFLDMFGPDGMPLVHGRANIPLPENAGDLGMMLSAMLDLEGTPRLNIEATGIYTQGLTPKPHVFRGAADSLLQLHNDWLVKEFIYRNLDVDSMADYLSTSAKGRELMANQQPLLAKSQFRGLAPEQQVRSWLEMKKQQILQQTDNGNPELLEFLRTGKMRQGDVVVPKDARTGVSIVDHYAQMRARLARVEEGMRGLDRVDDAAMLRALDDTRRDLLRRMKATERGAKVQNIDLREYVTGERVLNADKLRRTKPASETKAVAALLKERWERNEYTLPEHVAITERVSQTMDPTMSEITNNILNQLDRVLYAPLKVLTWADLRGTRMHLYADHYRRSALALEREGWAAADIPARATLHAAERVRDIMYDLSARTSIQRALKDLFWFAPAWQEIIYTWAVKIPAQYHWPIGATMIAAKGSLILDMLREIGVIQKDARGDDVVVVPTGAIDAAEWVANKLIPGHPVKFPEWVAGKLSGLNLVTAGGLAPGLSSGAGFLLGNAALKYGGIFKTISDAMQPYGPEAQFLPTPIVRAWELLTGAPPAFELFAPDFQKVYYDRLYDGAIQYAHADLTAEGDSPPRISDYKSSAKGDAEYLKDWKAYHDRWFALADEYVTGMLGVQLFGSSISPTSLNYSRPDQQKWMKFWAKEVEPLFMEGEGYSQQQRDLIDEYLSNHPNSLAYTTFTTRAGEKTKDLPFAETQDDNIWDAYYTGESVVNTPEEMALIIAVRDSRRFLVQRLESAMAEVGDTAAQQLRNGYARSAAVGEYIDDWQRYVETTPGAWEILKEQERLFADKYGLPIKSYEQQRLAETITQLNKLAPYFTNDVGMRTDEVRSVLATLKGLYSETGDFKAPVTAIEKARSWYFDTVLGPYIETTAAWYEKAQALDVAGLDAGPIYDRIRELNNRLAADDILYPGPARRRAGEDIETEPFPTPEEVFFGNRSPDEQAQTILTWATRNPAWLSNFQRAKVGLPDWEGSGNLLEFISESDTLWYEYIDKEGISESSNYYDTLKTWYEGELEKEARKYGKQGLELLQLQRAAPYVRLEATILTEDYMQDNYGATAWNKWKAVTTAAEYVVGRLEAEGLSPRSHQSELAVFYKAQLYAAIRQFRANKPEFNDLMRDLGYTMPFEEHAHREGARLYNALLFGDFYPSNIDEALLKAAGKGY